MSRFFKILLIQIILIGNILPFGQASLIDAKSVSLNPDCAVEYRLPIIMYHSTFEKKLGKYNIPPKLLEKDLIYIKEAGFETITVADLIDYKDNKKVLPKKPIMITFDDGYLNNYLYAYPLFLKHKMKCIISVVGELTDSNYDKNNGKIKSGHAHLNYEQIKEMSESGYVEIQNHTDKLHNLRKNFGIQSGKKETAEDYEKRITADILSLHEKLKSRSGVICTAVAYPFGSYSKSFSAGVLEKIGYKCSFTCTEKINTVSQAGSLFNLCRFNRPYGKTCQSFFDKIFKQC